MPPVRSHHGSHSGTGFRPAADSPGVRHEDGQSASSRPPGIPRLLIFLTTANFEKSYSMLPMYGCQPLDKVIPFEFIFQLSGCLLIYSHRILVLVLTLYFDL